MCISHFAREEVSRVFKKDIALFETTSLYGSTTSASQYDGLKPFIRYRGLTESKFLPLLHSESFHELHNHFTHLNDGNPLTENRASSKKLKRQTKMIAWIRNSLKEHGNDEKLKNLIVLLIRHLILLKRKGFIHPTMDIKMLGK